MHKSALTLALLSGIALFQPETARAQTVDAQALTQQLSTYLGKTIFDKKVLAITSQGSAYRLTLDVKPLADILGYDAKRFVMAPWTVDLTPQADGSFLYKAVDLPPVSLLLKKDKDDSELSYNITFRNYKAEGIYDPKLYSFRSYTDSADAVAFTSKDDETTGTGAMNGWQTTLQSVPAPNGVSTTFTQSYASQNQELSIKGEDSTNDIKILVGPGTMNGQLSNSRTKEIMDIWAYMVGNYKPETKPTPEQIKAVIAKVKAALPLWDQMNVNGDAKDIRVDTEMGSFALALAKATIDLTGIQSDSSAKLLYTLETVKIPDGLLPAWSTPFIPSLTDINVGIRTKDFDKALVTALDAIAATKDGAKTSAIEKKFKDMVLAGNPTVTLPKGRFLAPAYNFTYEGEIRLTEKMPYGTITVTAKDFDTTIAALQKAAESDPSLSNVATTAVMAKAFAKPADGGLSVWVLMLDDKGMMSVNGQKLGPISK